MHCLLFFIPGIESDSDWYCLRCLGRVRDCLAGAGGLAGIWTAFRHPSLVGDGADFNRCDRHERILKNGRPLK